MRGGLKPERHSRWWGRLLGGRESFAEFAYSLEFLLSARLFERLGLFGRCGFRFGCGLENRESCIALGAGALLHALVF